MSISNSIGQQPAAGISSFVQSYYFIDSFPAASYNNYRLKLIDRDGQYKYSQVISLNKK